jgi:multidrug resistance efflux pump
LPELDERRIPGWRFTRRAVGIVLLGLLTLVVVGVVVATVLVVNVVVDSTGTVEPLDVWPVRASENGIVAAVLVRQGDSVRAGQVVARLDSLATWASRAQLQAQVEGARLEIARMEALDPLDADRLRASVAVAEAHLYRARTGMRERMVEFGMVRADPDSVARASSGRIHVGLDAASADLLSALAEVSAAKTDFARSSFSHFSIEERKADLHRLAAQLAEVNARLQRLSLRARLAGVVLTDRPERLVGLALTPGQPVLEIGDTRHWGAMVNVSERDVHRIRVGDEAIVEIVALATTDVDRVRGRVASIGWQTGDAASAPLPTVSTGYRVVVQLDSVDVRALTSESLRRGYTARARIVTNRASIANLLRGQLKERIRQVTR